MKQDVEERNQQRDRKTIEQRREQVADDGDRHAPGVGAQIREQLLIDWRVHWIRVWALAKLVRCSRFPLPASRNDLPARSEQRQRENYFFGRHAAV